MIAIGVVANNRHTNYNRDNMRHLIFDCETFSIDTHNGVVIDFSAIVLEHSKMLSREPYNCRSIELAKKFKLSVEDQTTNYGWKIDPSTLDFWKQQGPEARKHIGPKPTDLTVEDFVNQFTNFLTNSGKIDYWWSRGNAFDPVILRRIYDAVGKVEDMNRKLNYSMVRDTRTFIDAKFNFKIDNGFCPIGDNVFWDKVFVKHDSRWDVLADALRIQTILRAEDDLEPVHR